MLSTLLETGAANGPRVDAKCPKLFLDLGYLDCGVGFICSASTILSVSDNRLGRFFGRRGGVSFDILAQVAPSFWLSLMVVAGASN